ncbi:MAG: RAD55 family ATPase [Candidatus Kariarchaeaceae archaeon]
MDISRIATGFSKLDTVLEGGLPHPGIFGVVGNREDCRKFILGIASQSTENKALYLTTKDDLNTVRTVASKNDINIDNVRFIDGTHWRVKRFDPTNLTDASYEIANLTDLNALLSKIIDANEKFKVDRIIFDTPSSLFLYSTPGKEQIFKFFELLTSYTRTKQITLIFTLEEGMHENEIYATMNFLSDGTILVRNSRIHVKSMLLSQDGNHEVDW